MKRILTGAGILVLVIVLAFYLKSVMGSGGLFTQTEHGGTDVNSNSTTGVYRSSVDKTATGHPAAAGECVHCHEQHASVEGSEPLPTGGPDDYLLMRANDNNLCYECHTASLNRIWPGSGTYDSSGHGSTTATYNSRDVKLCVQCHNPHGTSDVDYSSDGICPRMTIRMEENGCLSNGGSAGAGCHGNTGNPTGAKNIYSLFYNKTYRHPLSPALSGWTKRHSSTETQSQGWNPSTNRHVECVDCHNPHMARNYSVGNSTHTPPINVASRALLGTWGVEPTYTGIVWPNPPTIWTVRNFTTLDDTNNKEYQLCFKCHSYFAYGATPPSGYTDQSIEYNINNPSYHMVVASSRSSGYSAGMGTFVSPWTNSSNMYCSDCHGSDTSSDPQGPHGSANSRILAGIYNGSTGLTGTSTHLCFKCHDWNTYGEGGTNTAASFSGYSNSTAGNLHVDHMGGGRGGSCMKCHSAIPHGWRKAHLIVEAGGTSPDSAPYRGTTFDGKRLERIINWRNSGDWTGAKTANCDHSGC